MNTPYRPFWRRLAEAAATPTASGASASVSTAHTGLVSAMRPLALEQRFMFDGAGAVDAAHAAADSATTADAVADTAAALRHALMAEAAPATSPRQEVVFVDSQVANLAELLAGLSGNAEVVILDASKDGLQQMADYLQGRSGLDAIHLLSHGTDGAVQAGTVWLTEINLGTHHAVLESIGAALKTGGDILLYGCNLAQGDKGQDFLGQLAAITGADVAASSDLTGSLQKGGNWTLEKSVGSDGIQADALSFNDYNELLTIVVFDNTDLNSGSGIYNKTVSSVGFTFSGQDGYSFSNNYGTNYNVFPDSTGTPTGDATKLTIAVASGHTFDLTSFSYYTSLNDTITVTFTYANNTTVTGTLTATANANITLSNFSVFRDASNNALPTSANDIIKVVISSANGTGGFDFGTNNFDISDVKAIVVNSAPTIDNLNGDSVAWAGVGSAVTLDVGSNSILTDAEFGALNSGNGNWSGASLTVQRSGTAWSADMLGFNTVGALFTVTGTTSGNLQAGGLTFATYTNTGGVLTISFTSSGTAATTALVQDVVHRITYRNDTPAGDATVRFALSDGNSTANADVAVTSDTIYVTNATDTSTINISDGVSFSEAIAIAAADITGNQIIVIDSSLAGQTVSISAGSALNENLTLDLGSAHDVTLAGGSLAIGAGFNLEVVIGSGNTATITANLTNLGGFTKSGAGTLTLSGTNTYTGTTTVSAGVLELNGGLALSNNNSVSVFSGAELKVSNSEEIGALSGSGTVRVSTSQTLTVDNVVSSTFSGSLTGSGGLTVSQTMGNTNTLTLNGDNTGLGAQIRVINYGRLIVDGENAIGDNTAVTVNSNAILTLSSNQTIGSLASNLATASIQLGSFTLTVGGNNTSTSVSGVISGTGSLVKQGSGTLTLGSGSNNYSGGTTLSAGALSVQADGALGSGAITFNGGALDISTTTPLTFANTVNMTSAGTISFIEDAEAIFSGAFTGSGALTVTGVAGGAREVLTLSNSANSAGWSGTMTATDATFQVAADSMLSSGAITLNDGSVLLTTAATTIDNAVNIGGAAILYSNSGALVLSGVVSGSGALTTGGTVNTSVTLSGSNIHSGSVTVAAGKLILSGGSAIGDSSAVTISNSSTLELSSSETIGSLAGASGNILTLGSSTLTTGGNNSNTSFAGSISGAGGGLTKIGSGTLTLSGTNTNTGAIQISAGGLTISGGDAIANSASVTVSSGATFTLLTNEIIGSLAGAGTVQLNSTTLSSGSTGLSTTFSGSITGAGNLTKTGSGTLTLSGTNSYGNTTVSGGGTVSITNDSNIGTGTITVGNGSTLLVTGNNVTLSNNFTSTAGGGKVSNANAVTLSGVVSGGSPFTKEGAGVLTLSAVNTLNGGMGVSAGTLMLTGSLTATDQVTVMSGATLAGTGTITTVNAVTVASGATLAPGVTGVNNGVGTLTINGNLTMASGSTLAVDINGGTAGSGYDQVIVNGTVSVTGATLAVSHRYTASNGDTYQIINNDAADGTTGTFSGMAEGGTLTAAGNGTILTASYIGGDGNDFTLTAPVAPVVTGVSSSTSNGTYKIGDVVTIMVTFDTQVFVTGTPQLQLETGVTDRWLDYVSGSGSDTLAFNYTVQAGDSASDLDYVSTTALVLNGGAIRDGASRDAVLTLASPGAANSLGANQALVIDGVRPTASIVLTDTALRAGEFTTVTITFSEVVTGLTIADFAVANGVLSGLSAVNGGTTWTAIFTPSAHIEDSSNLITLDNTRVQDLAGNTGSGTTDSNNYAIDTLRPSATISVADTALAAGETTTVTITFNEAVTGLTTADFTVGNGTLSGLASSDGGRTWTAVFTPDANVEGGNNRITLSQAGVVDAAGNLGVGSSESNHYAVDTIAPVTVSMVLDQTSLNAQQTAVLTVRFSEAVTGLDVADFTVVDGVLSGLSSADGGLTWTATLTPAAGKVHSALQVALNNAGYTDLAGNAGSNTSVSGSYAIDTVLPAQPVLQVQSNAEGSATVRVDALEAGAAWAYSLDGGQSWQAGQGNVVTLASPGLYHVQVRQTNAVGNVSQEGALSVSVAPQVVPPRVEWPVMGIFSGVGADAGAGIGEAAVAPVGLAPLGFDADAMVLPRGSGYVFVGSGYATPGGSSFFGGGVATDSSELSSGFLGGTSGAFASLGVFAPPVTTVDRLVVLQPVDAVVAAADRQVDWTIPPTMFGHSDPLASVQFSMTLADGQPLPAWLKFDARTGQVSGVMPAGFQGELTLHLTARDSQGHAVSTVIKLKAADGGTAARAGISEQLQRQAQQRAGQMAAQRLHL